jgi:hypothetical protein
MRLMINELQRQLSELDNSQTSNEDESMMIASRPPRRSNPFDKKQPGGEKNNSIPILSNFLSKKTNFF